MAKISMNKAAKLAGKSRNTLAKHIKNGRLSAEKNQDGHWTIDVAELERVYGALRSASNQNHQQSNIEHSSNTPGEQRTALLEQEISFHKREIESLQGQLEEVKAEKRERLVEARAREQELLYLLKSQTRLLEAHKDEQEPAPKKRWRLFGGSA